MRTTVLLHTVPPGPNTAGSAGPAQPGQRGHA
ncbi:hypothetical protein Ae168Ps1_3461 [Pseudonocardia sp. Ae168_Ps1]|nr:hypothetical protein Ae150APs1_3438 [Pseudonocardia sp. Ae150A_Ps1]OLL81055.1 hypothetical protein Ae168Ps1_3461 [Pseudonocardia sp. Ae168_Ps1]OLL84830.1 hypothetical protein Ae263Ps1_1885c [Pseudonocardia sp. Ae263_Ps1]OLL95153.1 hypothetical protein Ae356Ps1_5050 [Pseudonocardia sp. Ae356_Ps1]